MNETILASGTPASSQIYGNICAAIREHILRQFPKDYFKYVGISSELASTAMRRLFGRNSKKEIAKQERPSLMIRPRYNHNTDLPYFGTAMTGVLTVENYVSRRSLFRVLYDIDNEISMLFSLNRDRIEFDITVSVYNEHSQIDLRKMMQNQMTWNIVYALPVSLECVLPKHMIAYFAKVARLKGPSEEGYDPIALLNYLNRVSSYPITYKIRNSTGNEEFFMYYNHTLHVYCDGLDSPEGQQKGMADFHYDVNFNMTVDFNLPGVFLLTGTRDRQFHGGALTFTDTAGQMVPIYTINNLYDDFKVSIDGFKMYTAVTIKTEKTKGETDDIALNQLLQKEHMDIVTQHRTSGNNMSTLIRFRLMEDSHDKKSDEWGINWDDFTLYIRNTDPEATYRVIVYMNNMKINEELVEWAERNMDISKNKLKK